MLIRFTVSNFMSFNEEVEFSMLTGKSRSHTHHIIGEEKRGGIRALKAGVIYGANASGKSNLVKAMQFARDLVVEGSRLHTHIPVNVFKLSRSCAEKPSKFEFEFVVGKQAYAYGFKLMARKIDSEWLYKISRKGQEKIFERELDEEHANIDFGNLKFSDKDDAKLVRLLRPRDNQLFLTLCSEAGVRQFEPLLQWFFRLTFIFPHSKYKDLGRFVNTNHQLDELLSRFINLFDTGISGVCFEEVEPKHELKELPDKLLTDIMENSKKSRATILHGPRGERLLFGLDEKGEIKLSKLMTKHKITGPGDDEILFELGEESDGTLRLLDLLPALLVLLTLDSIFVIDELHRSLHPEVSYKFMEIFLNNKLETNSQMIVTTHESQLLDLELLRRDEIWFVEKKQNGASHLYSLEEFAPRYDKDIRKGYLKGRFGAIPFVGNTADLGWLKK